MAETECRDEQAVRLETYNDFLELFASAPIRLMSATVSTMQALGYDDLAAAIGDLDWRTVPPDDPEDPTLREDWSALLAGAMNHIPGWLAQLGVHPCGYNLDSLGYPGVLRAWSAMWKRQIGIEFANRPLVTPQVFVFHGGNQALQAALLAAAERRRNRIGSGEPATALVPIPSFSCPLDQMALQGMRVHLLPPVEPGMDPGPEAVAGVPDSTDVDVVYTMPITNPTGRTVPPERLRDFVSAVLDRWPHAAVILDSVYVRLHPRHRELLAWYDEDPRFRSSVIFVDSLSKTHGVTGLRAGALLTHAEDLARGANRYAQNVMAGPSNLMQAVMLSLLAPFATGDEAMQACRVRLQLRIGRHLQRRRRLILARVFERCRVHLDQDQPVLPDPVGFDWEGSMYAVLRLSDACLAASAQRNVPPTVGLYIATGVAGVPLEGFCANANLRRHGLVKNHDDPVLKAFQEESRRFVRLSFGMTPPPRSG